MAWYNKYRPQNFGNVVGQNLVKSVLENSLKKKRIKNAYLLTGLRGVGKTTLARIFANDLNQTKLNPEAKIDIIELDAASNTGIDNIRELIENAKNPPVSGDYKVYIIDEVHMLSKAAMNALLKILEEPPSYLVFLLATTNPEKIIPTVHSRLTKLELTNHTQADLVLRLKSIAEQENLIIDQESLNLIASRSEGSQRDAINLLETISQYELEKYDLSTVSQILGLLPTELLQKIITELNSDLTSQTLNLLENQNIDAYTLLNQLLEFLLDQYLVPGKIKINNLEVLISAISKVVGQNLPLSSPVSALALIKVEFDLSLKKVKTEIVESSPAVKNQNIESEIQSFESESVKTDNFVKKKTSVKDNHITISTNSIPNQISNSDLQKFWQKLPSEPDLPAIFKMLLPNCQLQSFEGGKFQITCSSNLFVNQVKTAKNLQFLRDKLSQEFGFGADLEIKVGSNLNNPVSFDQSIEQSDFSNDQDFIQSTAESEFIPNDEKPVIDSSGKHFYKIYKKYPKNFPENKADLIDKIPLPGEVDENEATNSKPTMEKDLMEAAEELFEFE